MPKNLRGILRKIYRLGWSSDVLCSIEMDKQIDQAITEIKGLVGDTKEDTLRNMGVEE